MKAQTPQDMEKKLYFSLSDNADISGLIMELSGCMEHIKADSENLDAADMEEMEYVLKPVYLTDEEFAELPEYQY